ncbi:MAG TPA: hypothetical protein VFV23_14820 [Verrucomicrobiae bacterium]|nr:hypothetical protein [Verrucomicrobiae bacterium]
MKANHPPSKDEMRKAILELLKQCSLKSDPKDCVLSGVGKKLAPRERKLWVNGLSRDELSHAMMYHHVCMKASLEARHPH